jgi:hypothetical protein
MMFAQDFPWDDLNTFLAIIGAALFMALAGGAYCLWKNKSKPLDEEPLKHEEIDCSGCNGTGKVTYGPEHEFVLQGWAEPGTYTCPYCGGSGKLVREIR